MEIRDRVAVVTGASSGIGEATAERLSRNGASVVLAARRKNKLEALAEKLSGPSLAVECDVSKPEDVSRLFSSTLERFGKVDIVINNAGVNDYEAFHRQSLEAMESILRINLFGAIHVLRAAIEPMRRQGSGHIVNVASVAGHIGFPHMAVYSASKFALVGLTQALRIENRASGLTLSAFCPGTVVTPMAEDLLHKVKSTSLAPPKTAEQVAERIEKAVRNREAEIIYGEVPGFLVRSLRRFPRLTDFIVYHALKRFGPFPID